MAPKKILITGSNGMLGSALVLRLKDQHELYGLSWHENRHKNIPY